MKILDVPSFSYGYRNHKFVNPLIDYIGPLSFVHY